MAKERPLYKDRITVDSEIMVGKPVVKGTRIPVELVLAHLAENPDLYVLFAAYPRLKPDDVKACLQYAQAAVEKKRDRRGGTTGHLPVAGAWSHLDWDEMVEALDRIRHDSKPTPPIEL